MWQEVCFSSCGKMWRRRSLLQFLQRRTKCSSVYSCTHCQRQRRHTMSANYLQWPVHVWHSDKEEDVVRLFRSADSALAAHQVCEVKVSSFRIWYKLQTDYLAWDDWAPYKPLAPHTHRQCTFVYLLKQCLVSAVMMMVMRKRAEREREMLLKQQRGDGES